MLPVVIFGSRKVNHRLHSFIHFQLTDFSIVYYLKAPRTEVVLVVSRGRSGSNGFETIEETSATLDRAVEPLLNGSLASLLENDEDVNYRWGPTKTVILVKDGAGLGFSLEGGKGSISGDMPLTVKKIFVGEFTLFRRILHEIQSFKSN